MSDDQHSAFARFVRENTTAPTALGDDDAGTLDLLGAAEIAQYLNVGTRTIAVWRGRGTDSGRPFPAPTANISTADPQVFIPGWHKSKLPAIVAWKQGMRGQGWNKKPDVEQAATS